MSQKKIIAVIGATGAQGGGLAHAVLADSSGSFAVRAITRHPESDKAKALAASGAEVVAADADDPPSLVRAFAGAHGVFCVTNFWEHFSAERELNQAAAMARSAEEADVSHVVWSTLEDTRLRVPITDARLPTLHGKYKVPHFDAKGQADRIFEQESAPTTYLLTSFFWDNFIGRGMGLRRGQNGKVMLALPLGGARLPGIAVEDIGRCAYGIFRRGTELAGRRIGIAGDILTGTEMAEAISRVIGENIEFSDIPFDDYRKMGFPGADDLANMFEYQALYNGEFCQTRNVAFARELHPQLQSFVVWLERNKAKLPQL